MLFLGLILICAASVLGMPAEVPLLPGALPANSSPTFLPFQEIGERIISGIPAVRGQFPWQAALYISISSGTSFCGGSLINPTFILTAAHCTISARSVTAYLGVILLSDTTNRVTATSERIINHERYNGSVIANDVSLILLSSSVAVDGVYISTISLSLGSFKEDVNVVVSGWGRTSDSSSSISQTLNFVNLTTIANDVCKETYSIVQEGILCAKGDNIESTCNGDSGGPLMIGTGNEAQLVGIVSFGSSRGCAVGYPVGFTRVETYLSWIQSAVTRWSRS